MEEIVLKYSSNDGPEEILLGEERISFGRGSDADYRFEDNGISRLHASIYREDDYVWIVDENSTYGTFVNGEEVGMSGSPLEDGDEVKIGHETIIEVSFVNDAEEDPEDTPEPEFETSHSVSSSRAPEQKSSLLIPLAITVFALLIVGASVVFISAIVFGGNGGSDIVQSRPDYLDDSDDDELDNEDDTNNSAKENTSKTPVGIPTVQPSIGNPTPQDENVVEPTTTPNTDNQIKVPTGKKYLEMSDLERSQYIAAKAMRIARLIGNQRSSSIPPLAVQRIKGFIIGYAKRIRVGRKQGRCRFGDNLQTTYERARSNAPFIVRAFNRQGIAPQIGLYLAMIESEHCRCLQSPTGPLGMFQFTRNTGRAYGLDVRRGASPTNPDERCLPEPAAIAAAKYMKFLTGRYGTGPSSVPLAIGSYNSGEGGLSTNLKVALKSNKGMPRDFWSMIANGEKLSKQFQSENFKYVPKFFAAAIVGENPRDFGLNLHPLSTYSK